MTDKEYKEKTKQLETLQREIQEEQKRRKLDIVHENSKLVGKCFVRQRNTKSLEYFKVISEYSANEFRVECLKFKLPFRANIDRLLAMHGSRYPDCEIEATPFETESIMIESPMSDNYGLSEWTEITEKEFYDHMDICYQKFVEWSKLNNLIKEENNKLIFKKQKED